MPTYEYQCDNCKKKYEVFHKVREIEDDVECPECKSKSHTRLISTTAVSMNSYSSSFTSHQESSHSCSGGGCCGGSCSN